MKKTKTKIQLNEFFEKIMKNKDFKKFFELEQKIISSSKLKNGYFQDLLEIKIRQMTPKQRKEFEKMEEENRIFMEKI